jgi:hypothetical protein
MARLLPLLLLLLLVCVSSKKSPAKKVGVLKDENGRTAYAAYIFATYDRNKDGQLIEVEVDTANDEEPPIKVKKGYDDVLELFDIDLLDKDEPRDNTVSKAELVARLVLVEGRRLEALKKWCA